MKFFLPCATDDRMAEEALAAIRQFVTSQIGGLTPRRIYRLKYTHKRKTWTATVGRVHEREEVFAIVETIGTHEGLFAICTPTRGVVRGVPILVGKKQALEIEDFEPADPLPGL